MLYRPNGETSVVMAHWSVREVDIKGLDSSTRHLCGVVGVDGRVCSPIEHFNPEKRSFVTRSGKVYQVAEEPGYNNNAEYVWQNWCQMNGVDGWVDVTDDYNNLISKLTESLSTFNKLRGSIKQIDDLVGKCIIKIERDDDELKMYISDDTYVHFYHQQDCCESVYIEDICGDLDDLIGYPLLQAEESTSRTDSPLSEHHESFNWTFYKFATIKGSVTIRWYGTSNGYYSEYVDFRVVNTPKEDCE